MSKWRKLKSRSAYLITIILVSVLTTIVLSYTYLLAWSSSVQVKIVSPTEDIGVYFDSGCTQPVTSISVTLGQGSTHDITLYIKNKGNGSYTLAWKSNLDQITDKITDAWQYMPVYTWDDINGTVIEAGRLRNTRYHIVVSADTPPATYNWEIKLYVYT